jgi:hypothetical protein
MRSTNRGLHVPPEYEHLSALHDWLYREVRIQSMACRIEVTSKTQGEDDEERRSSTNAIEEGVQDEKTHVFEG